MVNLSSPSACLAVYPSIHPSIMHTNVPCHTPYLEAGAVDGELELPLGDQRVQLLHQRPGPLLAGPERLGRQEDEGHDDLAVLPGGQGGPGLRPDGHRSLVSRRRRRRRRR